MPTSKLSTRSVNSLYSLLDEYERQVYESHLSPSSKVDYIMFVAQFIRWIEGDFVPGGTLTPVPERSPSAENSLHSTHH